MKQFKVVINVGSRKLSVDGPVPLMSFRKMKQSKLQVIASINSTIPRRSEKMIQVEVEGGIPKEWRHEVLEFVPTSIDKLLIGKGIIDGAQNKFSIISLNGDEKEAIISMNMPIGYVKRFVPDVKIATLKTFSANDEFEVQKVEPLRGGAPIDFASAQRYMGKGGRTHIADDLGPSDRDRDSAFPQASQTKDMTGTTSGIRFYSESGADESYPAEKGSTHKVEWAELDSSMQTGDRIDDESKRTNDDANVLKHNQNDVMRT